MSLYTEHNGLRIYSAEAMPQGSEEWFFHRAGKLTASKADKIVTPKELEPSEQQSALIHEAIARLIDPMETGDVGREGYFAGNRHTDRGNALEEPARQWFSQNYLDPSEDLRQVGLVTLPDSKGREILSASPDALIYDLLTGLPIAGAEIKSPLGKNHVSYVAGGILPVKYRPQVLFSMALTGLPWWFVSYHEVMVPMAVYLDTADDEQLADDVAKMRAAMDKAALEYERLYHELIGKLVRGKEAA